MVPLSASKGGSRSATGPPRRAENFTTASPPKRIPGALSQGSNPPPRKQRSGGMFRVGAVGGGAPGGPAKDGVGFCSCLHVENLFGTGIARGSRAEPAGGGEIVEGEGMFGSVRRVTDGIADLIPRTGRFVSSGCCAGTG